MTAIYDLSDEEVNIIDALRTAEKTLGMKIETIKITPYGILCYEKSSKAYGYMPTKFLTTFDKKSFHNCFNPIFENQL